MKNPFNIQGGRSLPVLTQALIAFGVIMLSYIFFQSVGMWVAHLVTSIPLSDLLKPDYADAGPDRINAFKIIQTFADLGLFIFPAIILPFLFFQKNAVEFMGVRRRPEIIGLFVAVLIAITIQPLVDLSARLNEWLNITQLFGKIDTGDKTNALLTKLVQIHSTSDLILNTLFIALLPAIAEELFFRGFIQKSLQLWLKKRHWAVISAALIFSFIHFDFSGFLPRWLLGIVLGYAYLWSGDIKIPILIHFSNNFLDLLLSYNRQRHGLTPVETISSSPVPIYMYLGAFVFTLLLGFLLWNFANKERFRYESDPDAQQ